MALTYKIPSYQSIFDALVTVEVPLDSIVSILQTSDLDLDSDLSGDNVLYELTDISKPKGGQTATFTAPTTSTYTTNSTQNVFDVVLMTVGDLDKIVLLISQNDTIFNSINSSPNGVKTVTYINSDITDSGFKLALKKANINITTGEAGEPEEIEGFLLQGDGFYILQEDGFKILL
jgi:hypothetical protein